MRYLKKANHPVENTLVAGIPLAVVGGFLDAHSYIFRGGVFANAQTGNLVLLSLSAARGDAASAIYYIIPIAAYFAGVIVVEALKGLKLFSGNNGYSYIHAVLLLKAAILAGLGFLPASAPDAIVNVSISFICAMQVNTFRTIRGLPYATTMCTGNLRSAGEKFYCYAVRKNRDDGEAFLCYAVIIAAFCAGTALGAFLTGVLGGKALWCCAAALIFVEIICGFPFSNRR